MGTKQPYEGEPKDNDSYIVKETVNLEEDREDLSYYNWEIESEGDRFKGRAIARNGENIGLRIMEKDEYDYYKDDKEYWVEYQTTSYSSSIKFKETLEEGEYIWVLEGPKREGEPEETTVTVEIWKT